MLQIPYSGWQRPYSVELNDLAEGRTYQVRVKVIDHNNGVAYTSPAVSVQTASRCKPPGSAPRDLRATPLGPNQIRLSWAVRRVVAISRLSDENFSRWRNRSGTAIVFGTS